MQVSARMVILAALLVGVVAIAVVTGQLPVSAETCAAGEVKLESRPTGDQCVRPLKFTVTEGAPRTVTFSRPAFDTTIGGGCGRDGGAGQGAGRCDLTTETSYRWGSCTGPWSIVPVKVGGTAVSDETAWIYTTSGSSVRIDGVSLTQANKPITVDYSFKGRQIVRTYSTSGGSTTLTATDTIECQVHGRAEITIRAATQRAGIRSRVSDSLGNPVKDNDEERISVDAARYGRDNRNDGDYVAPSSSLCYVAGGMSWCGIFRNEGGQIIAPNGQVCGTEITCRRY